MKEILIPHNVPLGELTPQQIAQQQGKKEAAAYRELVELSNRSGSHALGFDEKADEFLSDEMIAIFRISGRPSTRINRQKGIIECKSQGYCLIVWYKNSNSIAVVDNVSTVEAASLTVDDWRRTLNTLTQDNHYKKEIADQIYAQTLNTIARNRDKRSRNLRQNARKSNR